MNDKPQPITNPDNHPDTRMRLTHKDMDPCHPAQWTIDPQSKKQIPYAFSDAHKQKV